MEKRKKRKNQAQQVKQAPRQDKAVAQSDAPQKQKASAKAAPAPAAEFAPGTGDLLMREMSPEGRFAFYALLVIIFLVPIAFNILLFRSGSATADAFDTIKVWVLRVGTMVVLAAWIVDLLKNGGEIRYHKIYLLVAGFLVWITISTVVSVSPLTAFFGKYRRYDGLWSYLIYAVLFFVAIQYVTSFKRIKLVAQTLCFSSLFVTFYGLLQAVGIDLPWATLPFEKFRSFSTYGNPDLLAGFLAFGFFITLGLVLSEERRSWRVFYWIVLLMNGVVMITAKSRSIWVGGAVGLVVAVILLVKQKPRWMKLDFGFAGVVGSGAVAAAVSSLWSTSDVMNFGKRLASIFQFNAGSGQTRFEIWGAAIRAIKQRPIFGWGSDTFRLVFRRFEPYVYNRDAGYRSVADNVHNFPLQLAAGVGLAGMLAFYAIMIWVVVPAIKLCVAPSDEHKGERMIFIGFVAAVIAYNVHLFFGLSLPGASFLLWILLGILIVPRTRAVEIAPVRLAVPLSIATIVLACVPCVFATSYLIADHYYYLASAYYQQSQSASGSSSTATAASDAANNLAGSIAMAQSSTRLNPNIEMYRTQEAISLGDAAQQQTSGLNVTVKQAEDSFTKLFKLSPYEYDSYLMAGSFWLSMAQQYESTGKITQARAYYDKTVKKLAPQVKAMPNGLGLRYQYAMALQGQGKTAQALAQLKYCMKGDSNFTNAKDMYNALKKEQSQTATANP